MTIFTTGEAALWKTAQLLALHEPAVKKYLSPACIGSVHWVKNLVWTAIHFFLLCIWAKNGGGVVSNYLWGYSQLRYFQKGHPLSSVLFILFDILCYNISEFIWMYMNLYPLLTSPVLQVSGPQQELDLDKLFGKHAGIAMLSTLFYKYITFFFLNFYHSWIHFYF